MHKKPKKDTIGWHREQIFKLQEKERIQHNKDRAKQLKKEGKIDCPSCNGKGTYKYHWQECGNAQIDEWVDEKCEPCDGKGWVKK